jgi:hypothetical protein
MAPLGGVPPTVIELKSALVNTAPSGMSFAAATTFVVATGFDAEIFTPTRR